MGRSVQASGPSTGLVAFQRDQRAGVEYERHRGVPLACATDRGRRPRATTASSRSLRRCAAISSALISPELSLVLGVRDTEMFEPLILLDPRRKGGTDRIAQRVRVTAGDGTVSRLDQFGIDGHGESLFPRGHAPMATTV